MLRIKELRERQGISQIALATTLQVNQTAVSQWERGVSSPSCEKLPPLAATLHCTIDDLFDRTDGGHKEEGVV